MALARMLTCVCVLISSVSLARAQSNSKIVNLNFTTIDVPGAADTGVAGINASGTMVGFYSYTNGGDLHSFSLAAGTFNFFDYPGASSTQATGINDLGLISGFEGDFSDKGFLYDGSTFTDVQDGNATRTFVWGVDNAGDLVGGAGTPFTTEAFVMHSGHFMPVKFPGSYTYAYTTGINSLGQIVGWADSVSFLYFKGKFKKLEVPGASLTAAFSINTSGIIVGYYLGTTVSGFALRNGRFLSFKYPGALQTLAYGINDAGQIVGTYTLDGQTYHGFVTSPIGSVQLRKRP